MAKPGSYFRLRRLLTVAVLGIAVAGAAYVLTRPNPEEWVPSAYYETQVPSSSVYVARPSTGPEATSTLPDRILRRGTLVELVDPNAGSGWGKVLLIDGAAAYVPLTDLKIILPENLSERIPMHTITSDEQDNPAEVTQRPSL